MKLLNNKMKIKLIKFVYEEVLHPFALSYVKSTSNGYDDHALEFLSDMISELVKEIDSAQT